jgi:outer membrane protein OmpA-like peptidoglycan-associated protein
MSSAFQYSLKALALAAVLVPSLALAQAAPEERIYGRDGAGIAALAGNPQGNPTQNCVESVEWTPALAGQSKDCQICNPDLCPKPAPKPVAAPAPKPAPKPEAKPEAKPAPKPKPEPQNVELKIELQGIAFNKVELTDDNKKEVDEFLAKEVKPLSTVGAVIVTGHTDRIGSKNYNKKLSEKRAQNARDYLVGKGIDQKVIFWEGKGPAQPIPVTKFCENKMPRKQLIECLSPNRRVTIEVVGVRMVTPKPEAKPAS